MKNKSEIIDEGYINKDYRFLIRLVVISVLLSLVAYKNNVSLCIGH